MLLYHIEVIFTYFLTYFRLFILLYHVIYNVHSLDSVR